MKKHSRAAAKKPKPKLPAFVRRAERAMRRAARNVRAQHRALNLPVVIWKDGKVLKESV